ncbi:MAG: O-antigen ligase family protein [Verrucomicrobia bacterium]|nr:O-antigen ligase family protein [Verrucomicrobiota bacterium]
MNLPGPRAGDPSPEMVPCLHVLQASLLLFAFGLPISIAAGQPMAYLASVLTLWAMLRGTLTLSVPRGLLVVIGLFLSCVLVASILGWNPARSFRKMDRFILLLSMLGIAAAMAVKGTRRWGWGPYLINAFIAGCAIKAALDLVRIPLEISSGVGLYDTGNMREPQMYLVGLCLLIAGLATGRWRFKEPFTATAMILIGLGLLLHFKRGTWISFALALAWMSLLIRNRKPMVVFLGLALASLGIPAVRARLALLRFEWSGDLGGRYALWTDVAPRLLSEHPLGVGWKAVRHEDLIPYTHQLQPGLEHLHSNVLQVALETGWLGSVCWAIWMGWMVLLVSRNAMRLRWQNPAAASIPIGVAGALVGLLANGMVEYNFGDSEMFMAMMLLMGLGLFAERLSASDPLSPPPAPPPPTPVS